MDNIKFPGTDRAFEKSRLVVQAYNDEDKSTILTQSPTVQRASQRLLLSLGVSLDLRICVRDISQAYIQSTSTINRKLFVKPPEELKLNDGEPTGWLPEYRVAETLRHRADFEELEKEERRREEEVMEESEDPG